MNIFITIIRPKTVIRAVTIQNLIRTKVLWSKPWGYKMDSMDARVSLLVMVNMNSTVNPLKCNLVIQKNTNISTRDNLIRKEQKTKRTFPWGRMSARNLKHRALGIRIIETLNNSNSINSNLKPNKYS